MNNTRQLTFIFSWSIVAYILMGTSCVGNNNSRLLWSASGVPLLHVKSIPFADVNTPGASFEDTFLFRLRGRLVYDDEETALYPLGYCSAFKPIHIESGNNQELHKSLLRNNGAIATVIGTLDLQTNNKFVAQLTNIQYVAAIHYHENKIEPCY